MLWRLVEVETRESSERASEAYGEPLENVMTFGFLGHLLMAAEDD